MMVNHPDLQANQYWDNWTASKLPTALNLFDSSVQTIVFNKIKNSEESVLYYKIDDKENILNEILKALHHLRIQSVLVEGGTKLLQSFIDSGNWDEARVITNTELIIENGIDAPVLKNERVNLKESIITDSISYYTKSNTND